MQGIIPEKHGRQVFDVLIKSSLESVVKEGEVSTVCTQIFYFGQFIFVFLFSLLVQVDGIRRRAK